MLRRTTSEVARAIRGHPLVVAVLVAAALVRLATAVTYAPALMWTDSWQYVYATHLPGDFAPDKPNGYMLMLELLGTRLGLVTAIQHLLGLVGAILMYAILRRLGCRPLLAAAATGVVAFDAFAIALEQHVLAEAAFTATLVCWAAVVVLLPPGPGPTALAGGLLVAAATLRVVALFVIPVWVVYAVWRERGWLARALAVGVPVLGLGLYGTWHDAAAGGRGLTQMDGWVLYGRTAEIGQCKGRTVPARDRPLCPPASDHPGGWNDPYAYSLFSGESPMQRAVGDLYSLPVDQRRVANARLRAFARDVIHDRPFAFARIVARDTAKYFVPGAMSALKGFDDPVTLPERSRAVPAVARRVQRSDAPGYTPPPDGRALVLPFYQRWVHTPRWLLAGLVAAALVALGAGLWPGRAGRRGLAHRGEIALFTGAGLALVVGSALNHFEPRFLIPAVPLLVMGGTVAVSELTSAWAGRRSPAAAEREVPLAAALASVGRPANAYAMGMAAARNVAIVLLLAAAAAFLPGGGTTSDVILAVLSTLILVSIVAFAARFYREHRLDLESLGDRWRGVLYGALGVIVLAMAARSELVDTGGGTLFFIAALAGAGYALYLVWRQYREYA